MTDTVRTDSLPQPDPSLVTITQVTYALHALGLALGAFGAATVVGSFVFGWPSIIAVILNYLKRGDARGTWLESHFNWQIRTFWWSLLWFAVGLALAVVLIGFLIMCAAGLWVLYRAIRGWVELTEGKPMPG